MDGEGDIHIIKMVGLELYSKKHVGRFFLGMWKRFRMTRVTMENSDIYILDKLINV